MKLYPYTIVILLTALFTGTASATDVSVSELKDDETLVFFNTSAWFNQNTDQWHVPIHGWVFEQEDSTLRKGLVATALKSVYGLESTTQTKTNFAQRVNWLLQDNERNKSIVIRFADRTYTIPESTANGHFSTILLVDSSVFMNAKINQTLTYHAELAEQDTRSFSGQVQLINPTGVSIISDIDDTIKISEVTNRKQLLNHTFYLDFKAVPGMAELYQRWLKTDGALHFVSSSPWQLYSVLEKFITHAGFPTADYALKSFRFKDSSLMNLFASSLDTKPPQIIKIIKKYPNRKFILIGDSGEKDPEVYAKIQQQFPQKIIKILIHNVTNEKTNDRRFKALLRSQDPNLWQLFNSVDEIDLNLEADNQQEEFINNFIIGNYHLIGKSLNSNTTYLGSVVFTNNHDRITFIKTITDQTIKGTANFETTGPDNIKVLKLRYELDHINYEETCLMSTDLNNYARLTCHVYPEGIQTDDPGLEALFIKN